MKVIILITFLIFSVSSWAHIPAVEALLENPYNPSIKNNAIVAYFTIEKEGEEKKNYKVYYSGNELSQTINRELIIEFDRGFEEETTTRVQDYGESELVFDHLYGPKAVMHSLLNMILLNNENKFKSLLMGLGMRVPSQDELLNQDKKKLLNKYKRYLVMREDNETMENPLDPKDADQKVQVNKVMAEPFVRSSGIIKIFKDGPSFYWRALAENAELLFDMETRKSVKYSLTGVGDIIFKNYILFNGTHEYPSEVVFKNGDEKYSLKLNKVYQVDLNPSEIDSKADSFRNYAKNYSKLKTYEKGSEAPFSLFLERPIN